jgi:predicted phosphate transport protein (TIGR00153 family)|tara:strand:- start:4831 stop:5508 length:678 start_codon:yes stop_codon:yes gene_type:complete
MKSTGFTDLIKKSPFGPIQAHMLVSKASVKELINFLQSAINLDWNKATESRKIISDLENEADALKAETRSLLTKSLFLAVPREDILDLIKLADDIPNTVKDISGLIIGRQMEIPSEIASSFLLFAKEAATITETAGEAVDYIDELFQFSFGGNAAIKMQQLLEQLDSLENKNDQSEINLRGELFSIERDLPPVNVIFLYDIINKIGELSDRAEQVGHRISLIASR